MVSGFHTWSNPIGKNHLWHLDQTQEKWEKIYLFPGNEISISEPRLRFVFYVTAYFGWIIHVYEMQYPECQTMELAKNVVRTEIKIQTLSLSKYCPLYCNPLLTGVNILL